MLFITETETEKHSYNSYQRYQNHSSRLPLDTEQSHLDLRCYGDYRGREVQSSFMFSVKVQPLFNQTKNNVLYVWVVITDSKDKW